MTAGPVTLFPVRGLPVVKEGHDLAALIVDSLGKYGPDLADRDVVVVTQKVVSKSEGSTVRLSDVRPDGRAKRVAATLGKDPRLVSVILKEATRVVRIGHGVIVTETKHGFVCANSGVDQSNVEEGFVTLLPKYPDRSARGLRRSIMRRTGKRIAVIVTDTFGRPWREGQVDVAIGSSGIRPTTDFDGVKDPFGYALKVTEPALVDEIAAAAELVMGKLDMTPSAVVRGVRYEESDGGIGPMLRERRLDLFR